MSIIKVVDGKRMRTFEKGKWIQHRKYPYDKGIPPRRIARIPQWPVFGVVCPSCGMASSQDIFMETVTNTYWCTECRPYGSPKMQKTNEKTETKIS